MLGKSSVRTIEVPLYVHGIQVQVWIISVKCAYSDLPSLAESIVFFSNINYLYLIGANSSKS